MVLSDNVDENDKWIVKAARKEVLGESFRRPECEEEHSNRAGVQNYGKKEKAEEKEDKDQEEEDEAQRGQFRGKGRRECQRDGHGGKVEREGPCELG